MTDESPIYDALEEHFKEHHAVRHAIRKHVPNVILATLVLSLVVVGCKGGGCDSDKDCKGDRVCTDGQCVGSVKPFIPPPSGMTDTPGQALSAASEPVPPAATPAVPAATTRPAPKKAAPRPRILRYECKKGDPTIVRGGCMCGSEIINLCYDPSFDGPQSPDVSLRDNVCTFVCSE